MCMLISIHDITKQHEQEMAYLRIKKLTESNIPGNKVSLEVNLTLDQVEKVEGIQAINYTEDKCYTVAKILNEISAQNIELKAVRITLFSIHQTLEKIHRKAHKKAEASLARSLFI